MPWVNLGGGVGRAKAKEIICKTGDGEMKKESEIILLYRFEGRKKFLESEQKNVDSTAL